MENRGRQQSAYTSIKFGKPGFAKTMDVADFHFETCAKDVDRESSFHRPVHDLMPDVDLVLQITSRMHKTPNDSKTC